MSKFLDFILMVLCCLILIDWLRKCLVFQGKPPSSRPQSNHSKRPISKELIKISKFDMYANYLMGYQPYEPPSVLCRIQSLPPVLEIELRGQLMDWASQYLLIKKFPFNLITIILKILMKEQDDVDLDSVKLSDADQNSDYITYNGVELRKRVIAKIDEICMRLGANYDPDLLEFPFKPPFNQVTCTSIKNNRRTMEDRLTVVPSLDHILDIPTRLSYFAVFDGHNGVDAANYAASQLHLKLIGLDSFPDNMTQAIVEACRITDDQFIMKCLTTENKGGTTVALVLFHENRMYVAWVGDSQVLLVRRGTGAEPLVNPHKPGRLDEIERIRQKGGKVTKCSRADTWRVNGVLAVSRAIGDLELKEFVIPTPDVVEVPLDSSEEYVILATDGLWDELSPKQCEQFVRTQLVTTQTHDGLSLALCEEAKRKGSSDNITVIIIFLQPVTELIAKYTQEFGNSTARNVKSSLDLEHLKDYQSNRNNETACQEDGDYKHARNSINRFH